MDETKDNGDKDDSLKRPILYGPDDKPILPSIADEQSTGLHKDKTQKQIASQPQKRSSNEPHSSRSLWLRIPTWLWGVIVVATLVITLLEGVPWLSVEENYLLDPNNPYSALFFVVNDGYAPISDLSAVCEVSFETERHVQVLRTAIDFDNFADYLTHSGRATIPCFEAVGSGPNVALRVHGSIVRADLKITITYSFYPITWRRLRRHQSFRFRGVLDSHGSLQWTSIS